MAKSEEDPGKTILIKSQFPSANILKGTTIVKSTSKTCLVFQIMVANLAYIVSN